MRLLASGGTVVWAEDGMAMSFLYDGSRRRGDLLDGPLAQAQPSRRMGRPSCPGRSMDFEAALG
jgi:hypothetical protein